jgi:hypothetical protein
MSFASAARELRRDALIMLETHRNEFIEFSSRSYSHTPSFFFHGPNHLSYGFGSQENNFVPRRFGYSPCPHRGDRFPCRPNFSIVGSYTHFEPRHLDGPYFSHHGSRLTGSNGEVQRIVKISSCPMVKCWIPKIYFTNPSTESLTASHPM